MVIDLMEIALKIQEDEISSRKYNMLSKKSKDKLQEIVLHHYNII